MKKGRGSSQAQKPDPLISLPLLPHLSPVAPIPSAHHQPRNPSQTQRGRERASQNQAVTACRCQGGDRQTIAESREEKKRSQTATKDEKKRTSTTLTGQNRPPRWSGQAEKRKRRRRRPRQPKKSRTVASIETQNPSFGRPNLLN